MKYHELMLPMVEFLFCFVLTNIADVQLQCLLSIQSFGRLDLLDNIKLLYVASGQDIYGVYCER